MSTPQKWIGEIRPSVQIIKKCAPELRRSQHIMFKLLKNHIVSHWINSCYSYGNVI